MNFKFAIAGLAALAGLAAVGPASASMPNGLANGATSNGHVENVRLVCDVYGRCFRQPNFYGPRYYGGYGYGPPRPRFYGGYGYGGPRFHGGGYRRW